MILSFYLSHCIVYFVLFMLDVMFKLPRDKQQTSGQMTNDLCHQTVDELQTESGHKRLNSAHLQSFFTPVLPSSANVHVIIDDVGDDSVYAADQ